MVNFHNFGGLIFHLFNCEELVRIPVICDGLVRVCSHVKNWYSIFTNVEDRYHFLRHEKNWYLIFTNVKNQYQIIDFSLYKVLVYTLHSGVIFLSNPWYSIPPLVDHIGISLIKKTVLKPRCAPYPRPHGD